MRTYIVSKVNGSQPEEFYGGTSLHAASAFMVANRTHECRVKIQGSLNNSEDGVYAATAGGPNGARAKRVAD